MADSTKYNGSTWEHGLRKLTTATDTLTAFPANLYADGNNAIVSIYGNMSQSGTPTPSSPIQLQECGDLDSGQYKIPLLSANTTTTVNLGITQTTRRIKKLVLDGTENFSYDATYIRFTLAIPNARFTANRRDETPCTHYQSIHDGRSIDNVPDDSIYVTAGGGNVYINIKDTTYTSLADFKAFLAAQYTAGTPVTIWYILATETTGMVNEPIRKIGDYADTVSGISIPTITGKDTFNVDTTLKPSKAELTYTGWHDAQCKEWDGSQWS